jgi:hypothetical protein
LVYVAKCTRLALPAGEIDDPIIRHRSHAAHVRERDLNFVVTLLGLLDDVVDCCLIENLPDRHRPHGFDDASKPRQSQLHLCLCGAVPFCKACRISG